MSSPAAPGSASPQIDPILRIVLRYSVNAKEYGQLHKLLVQRGPNAIQKRTPSPDTYEAELKSKDDYNAAAIRASVRVFLGTRLGLKLWESFKRALARQRKGGAQLYVFLALFCRCGPDRSVGFQLRPLCSLPTRASLYLLLCSSYSTVSFTAS